MRARVLTIGLLTGFSMLAEVATVKGPQVEVMRKAAKASGVVGTLEAGREVKIDYSVGNGEGMWCSVTASGAGAVSGYVLCEQLVRPEAVKQRVVMPVAEPVAAATAVVDAQERVPQGNVQKLKELELYNYHPFYWADRLGFSAAQRSRMSTMLVEGGVMRCSEETRQVVVKHGITQMSAFVAALSDPKFGSELMVPFEACSAKLQAFWVQFPVVFTPEQRVRFEADRRLVPPWTGFAESQMLLMFGQLGQKR